jgi:hypothetical protein
MEVLVNLREASSTTLFFPPKQKMLKKGKLHQSQLEG